LKLLNKEFIHVDMVEYVGESSA